MFGGVRILAGTRDGMVAAIKALKALRIVLVDKLNDERSDTQEAEMLDRGIKLVNGSSKLRGSRQHARRIGAKGGKAKGEAAQAQRNAILAEDIVRRLCEAPELSWRRKEYILGPPFKSATLRRRYSKPRD